MLTRLKSFFPVWVGLALLAALSLPFLYASHAAGSAYHFSGFLYNPIDGLSYVAKIYQGWEGSWRYQMAYSPQPGQGVYINLLYLFLGHSARLSGLPLMLVYHAARLLGAAAMLAALWVFYGAWLPDERPRRMAYLLSVFGAGLGWLVTPLGLYTADLWVAEAYPFLSASTNPHFPMGLALILLLLLPADHARQTGRLAWRALAALTLSIISPFGLVIVLAVQGGHLLWVLVNRQEKGKGRPLFAGLLVTAAAGAPMLIYDLAITFADPVIAAWNAQNQTPSPTWWDLLISFSPASFFALWALSYRSGHSDRNSLNTPAMLWVWLALGLGLMYLPIGFQRRFMMGLFIPLAGLAALGLEQLGRTKARRYRLGATALLVLALPTNILLILAGLHGADTHDAKLYLAASEYRALAWIEAHTAEDALILASPEMGAFIPAFNGRRVLYGHPFETVDAETGRAAVEGFFAGDVASSRDFFSEHRVDYLFYGPRERRLGSLSISPDFLPVYTDGDVILYQVGE